MPEGGREGDVSVRLVINESVCVGDSAAPPAAQVAPQRLRLADPLVGASLNILYQRVDPFQRLFVLCLPIKIVFPCVIRKLNRPIHLL